jgi:osmoprotectant transport system permease protein
MSTNAKVAILIVCLVVVAGASITVWTLIGAPKGLRAAFDAEFLTRPDGYKGLSEAYGFQFASPPMQMDPGLMYSALAKSEVDVIDGFATDGRIPAYDLVILEDDKGFFPPYYAAPLVRADTLRRLPKLKEILNRLADRLSDEKMSRLNYEVDEKKRKAAAVAREFLVTEELIAADAWPGDGSAGSVTVGGKHFTEQEILGQMMAILVECSSNIRVYRRLNLGGTMICFNAIKAGDIDFYAEYTGTGLVNILKRKVISDPDQAYKTVQKAFDEQFALIWLAPFGFNNTYTLTMRRKHAQELGIETISGLAAYIRGEGRSPRRPSASVPVQTRPPE